MTNLTKKQITNDLESAYKDAFEDGVIKKGLDIDVAKSTAMMAMKIYAEQKYGLKV